MKRTVFLVSAIAAAVSLSGCISGGTTYSAPSATERTESNFLVVNQNTEDAWATAVPRLGKQFFVINTMDKSSGLINLSYSGNPQKYIDCGRVHAEVTNMRGTTVADFAGSSPDERYRLYLPEANRIYAVHRRVELEGRINLVFEKVDATHTKITASTRYVVKRDTDAQMLGMANVSHDTQTMAFNSNSSGSFTNGSLTCSATGKLEADVLSAIHG